MEDITKALAYEIKQDIANRYFGFRKRIETESSQYLEKIQAGDEKYAAGIKAEMHRMHCLFGRDELFRSFVTFTKLPNTIDWYHTDPQSPSHWRLLFGNLKGGGLTRRRRYRNLVYKVYKLLADKIAEYQTVFIELVEEHEDICREIDLFYRKNDLSGILNFLREIDNPDSVRSEILQTDNTILASQSMEKELRIMPPPSVTTSMHSLTLLPPLDAAKETLDRLITEAYPLFDHFDIERLPF